MQGTIKTGIKRAVHEVYESGVFLRGWVQFRGVMSGVYGGCVGCEAAGAPSTRFT